MLHAHPSNLRCTPPHPRSSKADHPSSTTSTLIKGCTYVPCTHYICSIALLANFSPSPSPSPQAYHEQQQQQYLQAQQSGYYAAYYEQPVEGGEPAGYADGGPAYEQEEPVRGRGPMRPFRTGALGYHYLWLFARPRCHMLPANGGHTCPDGACARVSLASGLGFMRWSAPP